MHKVAGASIALSPDRETPFKKVGGASQKIGIKPLMETNLGVAQAFFGPLKDFKME